MCLRRRVGMGSFRMSLLTILMLFFAACANILDYARICIVSKISPMWTTHYSIKLCRLKVAFTSYYLRKKKGFELVKCPCMVLHVSLNSVANVLVALQWSLSNYLYLVALIDILYNISLYKIFSSKCASFIHAFVRSSFDISTLALADFLVKALKLRDGLLELPRISTVVINVRYWW